MLEDASSEVDRLALFDRAVEKLAPLVPAAAPGLIRPRLRAAHFARPLYVLVAAFVLAKDPRVDIDSLSRRDEAEALLDAVMAEFVDARMGDGHIHLVRGRWRASAGRTGEAADDLLAAMAAFDEAGDLLWRGRARQALRSLREGDTDGFDALWPAGRPAMPAWLAYPGADGVLADALVAWVDTPDWGASRTYLAEQAGRLLTDQAEAELEHLIDANPSVPALLEHLALLQAARFDGVEAAYSAHADRRLLQHGAAIVNAWMATATWNLSRAYAGKHCDDLLSRPAALVLDDFASQRPGDPKIRLHRGLLAIANLDGFEAAYALLDPDARRAAIAAAPADRLLALARLDSGLEPDGAEGHFLRATVALRLADTHEAAAALADCADHAAPFERADFARRLDLLASTEPELAPLVAGLRALLA